MLFEVEVCSWLEGRMVVVELDNAAAVRRKGVCIDIACEGVAKHCKETIEPESK